MAESSVRRPAGQVQGGDGRRCAGDDKATTSVKSGKATKAATSAKAAKQSKAGKAGKAGKAVREAKAVKAGKAASRPAKDLLADRSGKDGRIRLRNMSEVRTFFRTNETPIVFIGPTAFNLLGIDRWVRNFSFVTFYDSWDGYHPRVYCPPQIEHPEFTCGEDSNNYLLTHPAVREHIAAQVHRPGDGPKVAMVFFDERTEQICAEARYDLILPPYALRNHLDSKITTTRLGAEAGAPSVPNILTTVESWEDLVAQAEHHVDARRGYPGLRRARRRARSHRASRSRTPDTGLARIWRTHRRTIARMGEWRPQPRARGWAARCAPSIASRLDLRTPSSAGRR